MFAKIKSSFSALAILALFTLASFMAPVEAQAQSKKKAAAGIAVIAKTGAGAPIYDLEGDLSDFKYFSRNVAYQPEDLVGRMRVVPAKEAKANGWECEWICKNYQGEVMGLSPSATR